MFVCSLLLDCNLCSVVDCVLCTVYFDLCLHCCDVHVGWLCLSTVCCMGELLSVFGVGVSGV